MAQHSEGNSSLDHSAGDSAGGIGQFLKKAQHSQPCLGLPARPLMPLDSEFSGSHTTAFDVFPLPRLTPWRIADTPVCNTLYLHYFI